MGRVLISPLRRLSRRHARQGIVAAVAIATVALGLAGGAAYMAGPANAPRLAGADRYGTAAAVSNATFPNGASVAYLATGLDFADALTAAAAAGGHAPVLLVEPTALPAATSSELRRLGVSNIVAVGGPNAVGEATLAAVRTAVPSATISRIAGLRRYDTAAALSQVTFPNGASTVYVATGLDYPDALGAAAVAAGRSPVLLVESNSLPTATAAELRRLAPRTVHVVGGSVAVSSAVVTALGAASGATVDRVFGPDRFSTAAALSELAYPTGAQVAYVATGFGFPDALSAAVAAAGRGPVLLAGPGSYAASAVAEVQRLGAQQLVVVGGIAALAQGVVALIEQSLVGTTPPVNPNAGVAVATARAQLGKPYLWGGAGPDAFDCSGLVMFSWAAAGVTLPHNSELQADAVAPVAIPNLQPGDIVFYGTPGNVGHDGLYIGGGQMIEAAHSGVPVRIADINRPDLLIGGRVR